MSLVYLSWPVTDLAGEDVELELAATVDGDGGVAVLETVRLVPGWHEVRDPVPAWALRQLDPHDLAEDVRRALRARP